MTRWHVNNEPFTRPVRHFLEGLGHFGVVRSMNECRPHLPHEVHEVVARFSTLPA